MKTLRFWTIATGGLLVVAVLLCSSFAPAGAYILPPRLVTIDEDGHGTIDILDSPGTPPAIMPFALIADPGPGGLASVLTYDMLNPPGLLAGDVLMTEGVGGPVFDVIRFNPAIPGTTYRSSICFYSDNIDGFDELADTPGPPTSYYENKVIIAELAFEGWEGAFYTPTPNQPGFVPGFDVQYRFISDVVPEPGTLGLLGAGLGLLALGALRRR